MRGIRYRPEAREGVQILPPGARQEIKSALQLLANKKAAKGLDVKRLLGTFKKPLWRLRVGAWRVVFYEDGDALYVVRVFPRSQGYDWLDDWTAP